MTRILGVIAACALATVACGGGSAGTDLGVGDGGHDSGADLSVTAGAIGSACKANTDCTGGGSPVCWKNTLFNKSGYVPTHGGYCTSTCVTNMDCGANGHCSDFGAQGKFCLANCQSATDCARVGYACFTDGTCFPSDALSCDPSAGDGSCTASSGPGGCVRAAFGTGNKGVCYDQCEAGTNTCAPRSGNARHCVVDDERYNTDANMTLFGDKWVGPVCFDVSTSPTPIALGSECVTTVGGMTVHYIDICVDGAECYITGTSPAGMGFDSKGDNLCKQLCYLATPPMPDGGFTTADGGMIAMSCPGGKTCKDVFGLATSARPVGFCL